MASAWYPAARDAGRHPVAPWMPAAPLRALRPIGTYLYGRRLYEVMVFWETAPAQPNQPPPMLDYAKLWQAADKIVYSTTLETANSARTRIERTFDPSAVRAMKDAADRDLSIGGPRSCQALPPRRSTVCWTPGSPRGTWAGSSTTASMRMLASRGIRTIDDPRQ
jgi:hypothetical protein